MWTRLMGKLRKLLRGPTPPTREVFLYNGTDSGKDQVGRPVLIDGRKGKVIAGSALTITVEWD